MEFPTIDSRLAVIWVFLNRAQQVAGNPIVAVPPRWRDPVGQSDTKRAGGAFDGVVQTVLRGGLRSGSVWATKSLCVRQSDAMIIDKKDGKIPRKTAYMDFHLPLVASDCLQPRLDALDSGLAGIAEAVKQNSRLMDERGLHVKPLQALDEDRLLDRARNRFLYEIGMVQCPQIIVDIDTEIRFSGWFLQRAPRDTQARLAHATAWWHFLPRRISPAEFPAP